MANDHYISRFLTGPWETGHRRLYFYDFDTASFGEQSSESLFARLDLHSEETGKLLNKMVESPVSDYRARVLRGDPGAALIDPGDWRIYRALVGLIRLQAQRLDDLQPPGSDRLTLDQFLAPGEVVFDHMAAASVETHRLIGVTVPNGERLFFTEATYFPIPMVGEEPLLGVPLSPRHFVALPQQDFAERQLRDMMASPPMLTALSLGLGGKSNRVVIPPELIPEDDESRRNLEQGLVGMRDGARALVRLLSDASEIAGLPTWGLSS